MDISATLALFPLKISSLTGQKEHLAPSFRLGDQLTAKVLASTSGRLLLEIGAVKLSAATALNIPQGASLRLEVVQTQPKVQLKVLADPALQETLTSALRQALPKEVPLAQALNELRAAQSQDLPLQVRTQIEALLNSLPERDALRQPDKLAALVRLSGLFHEALSISETLPGAPDLKVRLLELQAVIHTAHKPFSPTSLTPDPTLSEPPAESPSADGQTSSLLKPLAEQTSGALARIVLDQLASLPKPDSQLFTWHLTLPYRDGERVESLRLVICGQPPKRGEGECDPPPLWTVDVELAPPGLDRLHIRLILEGNKVSTYFKSTAKTCGLLCEHLDTLAERLGAVGLIPHRLKAVESPTDPKPVQSAVRVGSLLDERT